MGLHSRRKHSIDRLGSDRAATNYDYVAGKVHEKRLTRRNKLRNALAAVGFTATAVAANLLGNGSAANAAPDWDRLASCESTGDWGINTGNGFFGGIQFDLPTWQRYGGEQYASRPDLATREQQIAVASQTLDTQGPQAWPDCSSRVVPGWWEGGGEEVPAPAPAPEAPIPAPMPEAIPAPAIVPFCDRVAPGTTFSSGYGMRDLDGDGYNEDMHDGVDCAGALDTPIYALEGGEVIDAGPVSGFGDWVRIQEDDGGIGTYGHMFNFNVNVGEHVNTGDLIAWVGNNGQTTGPHVHIRSSDGDPLAVYGDAGVIPNIPNMNPAPVTPEAPQLPPEVQDVIPEQLQQYFPEQAPTPEYVEPAPVPQNVWVSPEADAWIPDEIEPYIPQEYVPVEPVAPAPETFQEPVTPEPWTPPVEEAPAPVVEAAPVPEWVPPQAATDFQTLQAQIEQDFNNAQQNFNNFNDLLQGLPR
jgi:murein DD-endopeptidase MepM/ murein hydrolase activator NlpD